MKALDFTGRRLRVAGDSRYWELWLARPEARNAVDRAMRDELAAVLAQALAHPARPALGLLGEGPDFCAGGDWAEFGTLPDVVTAWHVRLVRSLPLLFHELRDRLVVGIHGAAVGAGIELAAFAGRVVATPDARFRLPELQFGLVPGSGGTVSVARRIGRRRTFQLIFSGQSLDAVTAADWGLVDRVVARADLASTVRAEAEATRR
jgi:enoyl-CoA hydratase/carnithine racemase